MCFLDLCTSYKWIALHLDSPQGSMASDFVHTYLTASTEYATSASLSMPMEWIQEVLRKYLCNANQLTRAGWNAPNQRCQSAASRHLQLPRQAVGSGCKVWTCMHLSVIAKRP